MKSPRILPLALAQIIAVSGPSALCAVSPSSWLVETSRPVLLGASFGTEASADLLNWTALATNTISNGPFVFNDPATAGFKWRFYRVRSP